MRLLLDENLPPRLAALLPGQEVATVVGMGWAGLTNGRLLAAAEAAGFALMLTADTNMAYQQSLDGRGLGVVVLPGNRLAVLRAVQAEIAHAIESCPAGQFRFVAPPQPDAIP